MKKRILALAIALFAVISMVAPFTKAMAEESDGKLYLIDAGEVLTDDQHWEIENTLTELSNRLNMDCVAITVKNLSDVGEYDSSQAEECADDIFDYNGYGQGADRSGILLLISVNDRKWHLSTRGNAIRAFNDYVLECMEDEFIDNLRANDYYGAITKYTSLCEKYITDYNNGITHTRPKAPFNVGRSIIIALVIGLIAAFIVVGSLKSKMKSVRFAPDANDYLVKDSLHITNSQDRFLYSSVSKTAKPKSSSSSGSSTHTSSSGASHGGRGGSF